MIKFLKKLGKILIVLILLFVLTIGFLWYENNHLVTTYYEYSNEKIPAALDGYKILQISDLHDASFGEDNAKLIERVKALEPDSIFITGDIIDSNRTNIERSLKFVEGIKDVCPIYYVTGNHELRLSSKNKKALFKGLKDCGVKILEGKKVKIKHNDTSFDLIGLDDSDFSYDTLEALIKTCDAKTLNIVLAHEPQYVDRLSHANPDLILSGHAHGGQFRLPVLGAVFAPGQGFWPEYTEGAYVEGNTTLYVSRGLGNSRFPFRLFNDPELVLITLKAE